MEVGLARAERESRQLVAATVAAVKEQREERAVFAYPQAELPDPLSLHSCDWPVVSVGMRRLLGGRTRLRRRAGRTTDSRQCASDRSRQ